MTLELRPATVDDASAVHRLTQAAFAEHADLVPPSTVLAESVADVAGNLAAHPALLALDEGVPVGALRTRPDDDFPQRIRWVTRVSVSPTYRRRGLGSILLTRAARDAASEGIAALRADVRESVPGYRPLYANLGWDVVATRPAWLVYGLPLARSVPTAAAMQEFGARLGALLEPGDLVLLAGPLGAGKTVMAQGIARGLEVPDRITSPTFVLAREHDGGRLPFVHVDAYRLGSLAELDDLDLDTPGPDAVTVVEWGAGIAEGLAEGHLLVTIDRSDDPADERRQVTFRGVGPRWTSRQQQLDTTC
jgi:tRNA threonylcarbamoyladenosine biosynthesis protein TsaE